MLLLLIRVSALLMVTMPVLLSLLSVVGFVVVLLLCGCYVGVVVGFVNVIAASCVVVVGVAGCGGGVINVGDVVDIGGVGIVGIVCCCCWCWL